MKLKFLGGVGSVTGSCYLLETGEQRVLIDCGMYQGRKSDEFNRRQFEFNPAEINCLFLTHSHIDHIGLVPRLVRDGFRGQIIATTVTADLVVLMLHDSARVQEADAEWDNKKALRSGAEPVEPLYTTADVEKVIPLIRRKLYDKEEELSKTLRFRFQDAGHILGSSILEIWCGEGAGAKKIVFSGDLGKKNSPIVNDPKPLEDADYLLVESTYGNRNHKNLQDSIDELVSIIKTTFKRKGNIIIPAFALGRTQDLLFIMNKLAKEGRLPKMKVFIDSPLAGEVTKIYLAHPEYYDEEAKMFFSLEEKNGLSIKFTRETKESIALNRIRNKAFIIASSGMCEGGRIRHHLKHNLWRKENSIVFTGYQAQGTLGRDIVDGEKYVEMLGERIAVKAEVHTLGGFSAHAGRDDLLDWVSGFRSRPEVFVVHGEQESSQSLAEAIREKYTLKTNIPVRGEEFVF